MIYYRYFTRIFNLFPMDIILCILKTINLQLITYSISIHKNDKWDK